MIRDVFYHGTKPNAHPREKFVESLEDARTISTTEHFWIINEFSNYVNFDWEWDFELLPDEDYWAIDHDNVWPSQHQKDSGTRLCPKVHKGYTIYRADVEPVIRKNEINECWKILQPIDKLSFDFSWHPDPSEPPYIHVFGNTNYTAEVMPTVEYHVDGAIDKKYISTILATVQPSMFFVDNFNSDANKNYEKLRNRFPNIQRVRYVNSITDTINRCVKKSSTELFWVLDSRLEYDTFDFDYYPNPWQLKMVHIFGTQWSRWGTTFLINRETFPHDTKYVKIIEHMSMINFVKDRTAIIPRCQYDIIFVDHENRDADTIYNQLKTSVGERSITRIVYNSSYLQTFKSLLQSLDIKKEHYLWICSSICDYDNFDFTYAVDPYEKEHLHVFPSDNQKFGDTFLLDVNKTREQLEKINQLEDYETINFNQTMRTSRMSAPVVIVNEDTHVNSIPSVFNFPYITMISTTDKNIKIIDDEPMNLWSPETKTIAVMSEGATRIIVPKEANEYIKKELYDYPYIKKTKYLTKSNPMDIVFLSNGEIEADDNYEHLLRVTHGLPNRVVRVNGVNGRVNAYHAAATASNTPWMFTVFAKLRVSESFDWSWQPDRMQIPKHYIFYAENPVNGLVYGHQAMIAYQKSLVLNNTGNGLDFTLDDEHEVVEQLSGVANFNTEPFSTWRTSFREVIKLKSAVDSESKHRLNTWLTIANGKYSEYCLMGANDADKYYDEVDGDFNKLKLSYEWKWLKEKFEGKKL